MADWSSVLIDGRLRGIVKSNELYTAEWGEDVLDLDPVNVGKMRYGGLVEDGSLVQNEVIHSYADLILCTGSTLCNGTIVDYMDLNVDVLFFGITLVGSAELLGLKRVCFADQYGETT